MGRGGEKPSVRLFSAAEVSKHKSEEDCWIVLRGKVYDVSKWSEHPGGKVLYTHAGQDASAVFQAFHSGAAYEQLAPFLIGEVRDAGEQLTKSAAFEADYAKLFAELASRGLFRSNKLFYAYKYLSGLCILFSAWALLAWAPHTLASAIGAGVLVAVFWQQCGWLAHDFAHHQVFKNRLYNDLGVHSICVQVGFSMGWWKAQHNTHHSIPNLHESQTDAHDGDPDIDTLPYLAWSQRLGLKAFGTGPSSSAFSRFCVRNQQFLYFPLLLFARLIWAMQSFSFAYRISGLYWSTKVATVADEGGVAVKAEPLTVNAPWRNVERGVLVAHYAWYVAIMAAYMTPAGALAFFAISQLLSGLLIAVVFGVGHNGMSVIDADKKPGFAELQVLTTRNVHDSAFSRWFMGGLECQVEHHLFPTLPRHNLHVARPLVEALCRKHGVPYHSTSLWEGTVEVLSHLASVAADLSRGPQ